MHGIGNVSLMSWYVPVALIISQQTLTRCSTTQEDSETVFKKYDHRPDKPRIHPILIHVGDEWDSAKDDLRYPDVAALDLSEMDRLCDASAVENPSWNTQLHMKALDKLLGLQDAEFRWWLPAKRAYHISGVYCCQLPPDVQD